MRDEVEKAWAEELIRQMAVEMPSFAETKEKWRGEPTGVKKFVWYPSSDLACFVAFRPLSNEAFDAFVGWTKGSRYPSGPTYSSPCEKLFDFAASSCIAWSMALVPRDGASFWSFWAPPASVIDSPSRFAEEYVKHFGRRLSAQEARELVSAPILQAIKEVRDFGVPFLQRKALHNRGN